MDYGMIGKIDKARRYAEECHRIHFDSFAVTFNGDNSQHTITFANGSWTCTCNFFQSRARCSHTMALERILEGMLPELEVMEP